MKVSSHYIVHNPIIFDGADDTYVYFHTDSWTRYNLTHVITIDKSDGLIKCSCEAGRMHKMVGTMEDLASQTGCCHIKKLCLSLARVINEGVEDVIYA